jgi:hypothetical protein
MSLSLSLFPSLLFFRRTSLIGIPASIGILAQDPTPYAVYESEIIIHSNLCAQGLAFIGGGCEEKPRSLVIMLHWRNLRFASTFDYSNQAFADVAPFRSNAVFRNEICKAFFVDINISVLMA